jgi:hypothetical protein
MLVICFWNGLSIFLTGSKMFLMVKEVPLLLPVWDWFFPMVLKKFFVVRLVEF